MNSSIGSRIKSLRTSLGISQAELAEKLGFRSKSSITKIEQCQRELPLKYVEPLAKALGTTRSYILGDDSFRESFCFPVVGEVAAGFNWDSRIDDTGDYEYVPAEWLRGQSPDNFFVCKVHSDSMYPLYLDGDRLLVRRTPVVPSGSIAIVQYDSDYVTVKKIRYGPGWLELIPLNREYAPKLIEGDADLERCHICGEVWKLIRDVA